MRSRIRLPPLLLLLGWAAAVLAGGLRSDIAWLAGSFLFWLLLVVSPPDGPALARMSLWWAWAGWVLLASLASIEPVASLHEFWRRTTTLLFFSLAWAWWGPRERRWWSASLFSLAAVLGAACVWGRGRGFPDGLLPPNPNYTACFLAAAASAAIWSAADSERKAGSRLAFAAAAAVYAGAAFWLRSRGAVFAIAGSSLLWAAFHRSLKAPAVGLFAALAVVACLPSGTLHGFLKLEDPLAYERPRLWSTALDIADERPWLGVGPGCFERGYFLHRRPYTGEWTRYSRYTAHAHSEPLQLAAETGWLGLGFLTWALAFFLPAARPASPSTRTAAGAFWAVLLHSLVDGVMALPAIELLFFCSLACASDVATPPFRFGPPRWRLMGAVGAAIALATWLPVHRSNQWGSQTAGAVAAEQKIQILKDALAVHPADSYARDRLAVVYMLEAPPRPALALWQLDEALRWNPSNAVFWDQKAELLQGAGDLPSAQAAAVRAAALEPNFVEAWLVLGELALAQARLREVRMAVRRIDEIRRQLRDVRPSSEYERLLLMVQSPRLARLRGALSAGRRED